MAKKKWLYKKNGRYYADFRTFSDVGGGQEAMKPEGERYATKDHRVAKRLGKARFAELRRLRKGGHAGEAADLRRLGPFVDYHLEREARRKDADPAHLRQVEQRLEVAVSFFGEDALLRSITTMRLQEYVEELSERVRWDGRKNAGSATIASSTQRKYLSDLKKLFRRARAV